jgi:hypothetical protein
MRRSAVLLVATAAILASPAPAQRVPVLVPGQRVRVTAPGAGLDGAPARLVALSPDTLVVTNVGATWREGPVRGDTSRVGIPLGEVRRLDVSAGVERHARLGMAIGGVAGGAVGALVGLAAPEEHGALCNLLVPCMTRGENVAMGVLAYASLGALIGWAVGELVVTEAWDRVPLEMLVTAGPARRRAVGLGLRISLP